MRTLLGLAGLLALATATPSYATTYLMDWSATGTRHLQNGGPGGYSEDFTVTESGQGTFTIDESKFGGDFHNYLTAFDLVSHVVETDHEYAPGFDLTLDYNLDLTGHLPNVGTFSFVPGSAGQPDLLSFEIGPDGTAPGIREFISGTNNVFSSMVEPAGVTTTGNLTFKQIASVPEPLSWSLMLVGFGVIGTALRRRTSPDSAYKGALTEANVDAR